MLYKTVKETTATHPIS